MGKITSLRFVEDIDKSLSCKAESLYTVFPEKPLTPLLQEGYQQLEEYFAKKRQTFQLPLSFTGTTFQCKVWNALSTIPYGATWSYEMLARAVGSPQSCRAVGSANGKNPLPIFLPCHRVITKSGKLGGYSGGIPLKQQLLSLEGNII